MVGAEKYKYTSNRPCPHLWGSRGHEDRGDTAGTGPWRSVMMGKCAIGIMTRVRGKQNQRMLKVKNPFSKASPIQWLLLWVLESEGSCATYEFMS